jgi:AcrR family transcriptional regulator
MNDPIVGEVDARILEATVNVLAERGYAGASVARIARRAQVATRTFHRFYDGVEDCLLAVMDRTLETLGRLAAGAFAREDSWQDGLRMALACALRFFDENPELTRVCLVETLAAGPAALRRRERNIQAYRSLILGLAEQDPNASSLAIEGVMASVVGILYTRVIAPEQEPLVALLGPLTGWMMTPFLAHRETQAQVERATEHARKLLTEHARKRTPAATGHEQVLLPPLLRHPAAHRLRLCVLYLHEHPGASNREISRNIGVAHQGQVSLLLTRLARADLLTKQSLGPGYPCESRLTVEGERIAVILQAGNARTITELPVIDASGRPITIEASIGQTQT